MSIEVQVKFSKRSSLIFSIFIYIYTHTHTRIYTYMYVCINIYKQLRYIKFSKRSSLIFYSFIYIYIYIYIYIIDYAIRGIPISPLFPPPPSTHYILRQSPHNCSCPCVMHISSLASSFPMLDFTSRRGYSVTTYLYFLILSPLHHSLLPPSHVATIKIFSVSMILSLFFLFA